MDSVMKDPKVSILMSVFNGERYLKDAIESMLSQDFENFEFLIINDGSTDESEKIITSYTDVRIRLINNGKNIGLVSSLNKAIGLASGEYIVRMDCDDVSLKNRLSLQVKFMDNNKNIGASGSYYNLMYNGKKAVADFPLDQKEIKCYMLFNSPIAHPSAIIRRSLINEKQLFYRSEFIHAEDYDLWSQISEYADLANVSDVLLNYRIHGNQITGNLNLTPQKKASLNIIRLRHLKSINLVPSDHELFIHNLVSDGRKPDTREYLKETEVWLKKIVVSNRSSKILDASYLEKIVLERWLRMCFNYFGGRKGIQYFFSSELHGLIKLPINRKLELLKNLYYSYKRKKIKK